MSNIAKCRYLAVLATLTLVLAGCGKKDDAPSTAFADADGLLRYVPADTPYFFGALEPAPPELVDKFEPMFAAVLNAYGDMLEATADSLESDPELQGENTDDVEIVLAVLRGLRPMMSPGALEKAGVTRESLAVIYGHGLLPVVRLTVSDSDALDARLAEMEKESGHEFPVDSVQGRSYRYFDAETMRVVMATIDDQFVLTVMPTTFSDEQLAELLGLTLPDTNLGETTILQEIADEYGYLAQFIGFTDIEGIAATFIDGPTGLDAGLLQLAEHDAGAISDVCKAELRDLAAVMPRIVTGYEAISAERLDASAVIELRQDLATGLSAIPTVVPGMGKSFDGLFSIGLSVDVLAAREFYEARIEAVENDPFECELLDELQESVARGREALNQPVPPIIYGFKGILAVVTDMKGFDPQSARPPESVDGSLLVSMDNAAGLLAFGQMFSPDLYELDLQPDGKPQRLQLPVAQAAGIDQAWIAMTDDALAISVAENGEQQLPELLSAEGASPPPFIAMNMDANRYYTFIAEMTSMDTGDEEIAELQAASSASMAMLAELYDRFMIDVLFTERGIEVNMDTTFAD